MQLTEPGPTAKAGRSSRLSDRAALAVASVGGAGFSPIAPGTAGTLATVPLYLALAHYASPEVYIAATLALLFLGIAAAERACRILGQDDPGVVVIDETVGFLVTMTLVEPSAGSVLLGFAVFRLLDVFKPLGIDRLEKLPGGYGIMMDDFAAGVVGNLVVRIALQMEAPG